MKRFYTTLFMLSVAVTSTQAVAKTVKHKIKNGETLYTIAHQHHTTIAEVREVNHLKKDEVLNLGRVLTVPEDTYFPNKKESIVKSKIKIASYTIQSGDTLYSIAHQHHTTIAEVQKSNQLKKGEVLKLGRTLSVPTDTYFPGKTISNIKIAKSKKVKKKEIVTYTIKRGDTLFSIARKHHTTIAEVEKSNKLTQGEVLKLGRVLTVPKDTYFSKKIKIATKKKKLKIAKKVRKKSLRTTKVKSRIAKKKNKAQHVASVKKHVKSKHSLNDIFFGKKKSKKSTKITSLAKKKLGRRYVWGATGKRNTFDCSGLTTYVYQKNGIRLPRRAIAQSKVGKYISRSHLKPGDLIFFDTSKRRRGYVNHVGIYIGNGKFIHASSAKKKVIVTSLNKPFYSQRFKWARRLIS